MKWLFIDSHSMPHEDRLLICRQKEHRAPVTHITAAPSPGRSAFTLVELLVCIAIIVLLVTVLVPSLARVRATALLTTCKTNLHSLSLALNIYAAENDSNFPVDEQLDNPHNGLLAALNDQYIPHRKNFYCPSQTKEQLTYSKENLDAGDIGYFYFSCRSATKNKDVSKFLRNDVRWPRALHADKQWDAWIMSDCWFRDEPTPHQYYNKYVNYVTVGGVVEMVESSPRSAFK